MKYIATREGVEIVYADRPPTQKQKQLIKQLLRDFPDSEELFEYKDYQSAPTCASASAFISMALDTNAHTIQSVDGYMKYIATRPRAERLGEHGLFSAAPTVDLQTAVSELEEHDGNVWTVIYSLRREDAVRLNYDNVENWRNLLISHQTEFANAMHIPPNQFRWYAAFHNEGHHPHVHMMIWSEDPKHGYLTKQGIMEMRSKMTNAIFKDELNVLYREKDKSYKQVTNEARTVMEQLIRELEQATCDDPVIIEKMEGLSQELETVTGKKVYGYLSRPCKRLVDSIVDEIGKIPEVSRCYEEWNRIRDELEGYYKDAPREYLPLSQQKEFRVIKNMVIREAENIRLGVLAFEDAEMDDEPEPIVSSGYKQARDYRAAKELLYDRDLTSDEKQVAVQMLEQLWDEGFTVTAHQLGKVWRDGLYQVPDEKEAELWFRRSAEAGNDYSEYALGKLLLRQRRIKDAVYWLEKAAGQKNQYARYLLGKLYLGSEDVPQNMNKALDYLTAAANQGNQYAQYALGKLYLQGRYVERDKELAEQWFQLSAEQGNTYAQFFMERLGQEKDPSILLAATRLLVSIGQVFRENLPVPSNPKGIRMDSKRRRKLMRKRLAMGHKPDDHVSQKMM